LYNKNIDVLIKKAKLGDKGAQYAVMRINWLDIEKINTVDMVFIGIKKLQNKVLMKHKIELIFIILGIINYYRSQTPHKHDIQKIHSFCIMFFIG
jgi:hypothetical protein